MKHTSHHIDYWFKHLQQLGEDTDIEIDLGRTSDSELRPYKLPHEKFDGLSLIHHTLVNEGLSNFKIPTIKDRLKPNFLLSIRNYIRFFYETRPIRMNWKFRDLSRMGSSNKFHKVLSNLETQKISRHAKNMGISLNTYILWCANKAASDVFLNQQNESWWTMPVNIRGLYPNLDENSYGNQVSYIVVKIKKDHNIKKVQNVINRRLKSKSYRANWFGLNLAKKMGEDSVIKTLQNRLEKNYSWVGVLTNLGTWPSQHFQDDLSGYNLIPYPPSIFLYPISIGTINWFGRQSFGFRVHRSVYKTEDQVETFVRSFIDILLSNTPEVKDE